MTETTILAAYGLLVMLTILLQVLGGAQQLSLGYLLSSRDEDRSLTGMTARLKRALAAAQGPGDALRIRYALAKELEDLGDPSAFEHLAAGNAEQKRALGYDFAQDAVESARSRLR